MQVQKTPIFQKTRGCNITGFFINLCFAKCEKLLFFGQFFAIFLDFQQNTIKIGISAHFSEQTFTNKMAFLEVIIWSKLEVIIWSKLWARLKKRQLGPDNNFQFFLRAIFSPKMC